MYDNILKALNEPTGSLTYEEQAQNYTLFSDLMKKGVKLQDLIDKANAPKEPGISPEYFSKMEDAVKNENSVKLVKSELNSVWKLVLHNMCMGDPAYAEAYQKYKDEVTRTYLKKGDPESERTTE